MEDKIENKINGDEEIDWIGCTIHPPYDGDGHILRITARWKPDKYFNTYWWKCDNCIESSGVLSSRELEKLQERGLVDPPEDEDAKIDTETKHPKDEVRTRYDSMYEYYGEM